MFRIIVLTNYTSSDFEARACENAEYLLELYAVHHQVVNASEHPAMCKQLLRVSGAIPVFPQFYLQDEVSNELCILGEFYMVERMLYQGVLPGQKDPADVCLYDEEQVEYNPEEPQRLAVQRSQSMQVRPTLCRGNTIKDDDVVAASRPKVRATQSMKPLVVRNSSFGINSDTNSMCTIQLDNDSDSDSESEGSYEPDSTENSFTELVLLEDEPTVNHDAMTVRSPPVHESPEKEKIAFSSTGYMEPPSLSPFPSSKTFEETEKEIWRMMKQDDSFDREEVDAGTGANNDSDAPERFVTPAHSFNLPLQQAMPEPMAPKAGGRPKLQLDFEAFMQSGGSFRQKLVRGHSLLQSNPASRSASFCSQDGTIPMAPGIDLGSMMPPPPSLCGAPSNEPSGRYITPQHSFVGNGGLNMPPSAFEEGKIEPNAAPQATRNVITVGDFERCALPGADSFRRQIVRGNSLLASNNSNSFRRSVSRDNSSFCRSVTRGVSRYSTDDSLAPLKEEVKVDKSKRRASKKKTVRIVMSDDDDEEERAASVAPPKPKLFGLVRKSSIMRPGTAGADAAGSMRKPTPWEGSSSHHTKTTVTTVDVSHSEDLSDGASFGDSGNNDCEISITGGGGSDEDDSDSDSSTEFEELEDDLALQEPRAGLKDRNLSFVSTASTQSWSLYESFA